jgi:hypothetical protein
VKVIATGMNEGIAKLSYQLNLQSKGELYVRRAVAHSGLGEWQSVIDDVGWLRGNGLLSPLALEIDAVAHDNLGQVTMAIAGYEQAAMALKDATYYGVEEFNNNFMDAAWRSFKIASYEKRLSELYQAVGRTADVATSAATAQKLIESAYASPDLTPQTRMQLDELSGQDPKALCSIEGQYKSAAGEATQITLTNQHGSPVRLYWLDYSGARKLYATINPGASFIQQTYRFQAWVIADLSDACIGIYLPQERPSQIAIR